MTTALLPNQVQTSIHYVVKGESTIFYPGDRDKSYWPGEDHTVTVTDMRPLKEELSVAKNGFALLTHQSEVTDYTDRNQIDNIFYPEMIELAKQVNGASKVIAFGEVARTDAPNSRQHLLPAFAAHVDYGRKTIDEYARRILGDEAEYWLKKRVVLMNFWRPVSTVYRSPLALCDASTVYAEDLNPSEVRGGLDDPDRTPLWGYNLNYSPDHRWYYTFEMQPEEIYAFKLYDSDSTRPQWTGHTAIELPDTPKDAPPRHSIEIRTISFIDE
jgi:hypothetical protein